MKHVMRNGTGSRWHGASLVGFFLILWFTFLPRVFFWVGYCKQSVAHRWRKRGRIGLTAFFWEGVTVREYFGLCVCCVWM